MRVTKEKIWKLGDAVAQSMTGEVSQESDGVSQRGSTGHCLLRRTRNRPPRKNKAPSYVSDSRRILQAQVGQYCRFSSDGSAKGKSQGL